MLMKAYEDVKAKGMSMRTAARYHGVPESTLRARLSSGKPEVKVGAPTIFTRLQEEKLSVHCTRMAHLGYRYTRCQIMDIAKHMCQINGKQCEPTKHWYYAFVNRFSDIKTVIPTKGENPRDDAVSPETLRNYFSELNQIIDSLNIKAAPSSIWNVEETTINLDHSPPQILTKTGTHTHVGRSANTTVITASSALGDAIPPYIISKGERFSEDNRSKGLKGTQYRATPTGWSDSETFLDFFTNHFQQHFGARPCLLLYDGQSTHINPDIIETARQKDTHMFVMPPHTSQMFKSSAALGLSPFKQGLNSEFHNFLHLHPNSVITIDLLPECIANCYNSAMCVSNITAGFRKSGVYPLDPSVVPGVTTPTT